MFTFSNIYRSLMQEDTLVGNISNASGVTDLMNQLSVQLKFPEYFGFSWDALFDCLCDLSWINERNILLIHDGIPKLSNDELKDYIDILSETINVWRKDGTHSFEVLFPSSSTVEISKYV